VVVWKDDSGLEVPPAAELRAEGRHAVFVGNHNFCDNSCLRGDQKPRLAAPGFLEAGAPVRAHFVVAVLGACSRFRFFGLGWPRCGAAGEGIEVADAAVPAATLKAAVCFCFQDPFFCPG
jgi:hypothetical protein